MMLSIRGERKLSFFVCNAIAQTIGRDSSERSQGEKRLTFCDQDSRSNRERASEFLPSKKRGATPWLHAMASSIRRIGITCYTSLIIIEKFTFKTTFLWHTKSSGNHLRHGPLCRPSFISNMVFYVFHFLGQKWNSILIHEKGENYGSFRKIFSLSIRAYFET